MGIELTQAFARLGAEVTVFEPSDALSRWPILKPRLSCARRSRRRVFASAFGARVERVRKRDEAVVVTDRGEDIEGDALLVAAGRRPVVKGLDVKRPDVVYTDRGVQVDEHLRPARSTFSPVAT